MCWLFHDDSKICEAEVTLTSPTIQFANPAYLWLLFTTSYQVAPRQEQESDDEDEDEEAEGEADAEMDATEKEVAEKKSEKEKKREEYGKDDEEDIVEEE